MEIFMPSTYYLPSWRFYLVLLGVIILAAPGTGLPSIYSRVEDTFEIKDNVDTVETNPSGSVKVCRESTWYDPIVFILLNHVVHLFSIKGWPDETIYDTAANLFLAFFMPYTGIWRCYVYFNALPVFLGNDDLQKAKWAGALCMVARGRDWEPEPGAEVSVGLSLAGNESKEGVQVVDLNKVQSEGLLSRNESRSELRCARLSVERVYSFYRISTNVPLSYPRIHGQHKLPKGYVWLEVPPNANVLPLLPGVPTVLASNPKVLMGLAAIGQLFFACLTLYWGQNVEQKKAGYTEYSLTVIPYAIMSFLNLIVASFVPDYSTRYLVRNTIMEEAELRGGQFSVTAGTLQPGTETSMRYPQVMRFEKPENHHGQQIITAVGSIGHNPTSPFAAGDLGLREHVKWIVETGYKVECARAPVLQDRTAFRGLLGIIKMPPTAVEKLIQGDPQEDTLNYDIISVPSVDLYLTPPGELYRSIWAARFIHQSQLRVPFLFLQVLPYILIGGLTGFHIGRSRIWDRFWFVYWLVTGQLCGGLIEPFKQAVLRRQRFNMSHRIPVLLPNILILLGALAAVLAPSIAIFIMVWRQVKEYGICKVV